MVESYLNVKNGCSKWHDCFTCPLKPDCQISWYENMRSGAPMVIKQREEEVLKLIEEGLTYREISKKVGYTERTIKRIKRKYKQLTT